MSDDETKKKKSKKKAGPKRMDRRFIASSAFSPTLVKVLGALGAMTLGAGLWAYMYGHAFENNEKLTQLPSYLIAAGAVLTGAAIWLGTGSETPLRVGDPGIAMERGEVRRMPWYAISQITFESGNVALVVSGKDESGTSWTFKVPVRAHAEAVGWILKEALARVPKVVDIKDDVLERLPAANPHAGMRLDLEPLQVVGKKDAVSGKLISYEPDARVCERCERVYFKRSVPKRCKCGASLVHLLTAIGQEPDDEDEDDEDDDADIKERNRRELEGTPSTREKEAEETDST